MGEIINATCPKCDGKLIVDKIEIVEEKLSSAETVGELRVRVTCVKCGEKDCWYPEIR